MPRNRDRIGTDQTRTSEMPAGGVITNRA